MADEPAARPRPWRDRLLCLAAGAGAGFAHPPWGLLPGLLGYALLLWLLDRELGQRPLRAAFVRGWLAGCGYFMVSVWWLAEPFQVDSADQGWMAPFAVALMAMGLALFWGCAALWAMAYMTGAGRRSVGASFRSCSSPASSPPSNGCAGTS